MRPVAFALLAAFASFALSACSSDFDPGDFADKLDFFHLNEKKKLPGERKELFPGGVPGVEQGIPPDLVKGYQAPQTPPEAQEAQTPPAQAEKPKPKPRVAHRAPPKKQPAQVKVTPPQQTQQQQQAQQQQVWPDPKPQQPQAQQQTGAQSPWPAQPQQTSPWPAAPPPNTFQH
jgi:hypothetical protein